MTSRATFGDFLRLAHRGLDPGGHPDGTATAGENLEEIIRALARLVTVMRCYTRDLTATLPEITPRAQPVLSPCADACTQAHEALATVARFLALRDPVPRPTAITQPSAQARRLERAAASLRMGRDLLHTHFSVDTEGVRRPRSEWAPAITSEPVTRALLTEIARIARQAADQCSALALSQSANVAGDGQARRRLNAACQWLWMLEASARAAHQRAPTSSGGTELLSAIPVNTLPPRCVVRGGEPVTVLCEGAISSAERVRHLAWMAADRAAASQNLTVASLRQVAEHSTVTSHNCASLLGILAACMAQAGHAEASSRLTTAAEEASQARDTWLRAAREVTRIRTATPDLVSPAAIEAAELTLWTGRLAYADPDWSPSHGPAGALRPPETLAMEDLPQVIAVAHHACETLTSLACAEHDQVRAAAIAGRILVPTRSLPDDYDIPYPFARAPRERVVSLLKSYAESARASRRTADTLGGVAAMAHTPSRTLALARSAVTGQAEHHPDVTDPAWQQPAEADGQVAATAMPGPVQTILLDLGVNDVALLTRSAELDREAERLIIDAVTAADPHKRPARELSRSTGTAALVNHALQSGDPRAVTLLRPPVRAQREPPEREP